MQRKVSRLPRFLPLQLLRYKVQQSGQFWKRGNERVKISTIVRFPLDYLDLGHMLDPGCLQARSGERFVYRLYAIVVSKAYAGTHTHTRCRLPTVPPSFDTSALLLLLLVILCACRRAPESLGRGLGWRPLHRVRAVAHRRALVPVRRQLGDAAAT